MACPTIRSTQSSAHALLAGLLPGCRWPFESGALQLFHGLQLHSADHWFFQHRRKDSLNNIEQTGEFAWNLATRPLAEQMNQSCAMVGPEVNEFELSGLTTVASKVISVPRVAEARCPSECKVTQIIQLQRADGNVVPSWLILGEVVAVHIARRLLKDGVYDTAAAEPILRGGGPADYFQLGPEALFKMYRPGAVR